MWEVAVSKGSTVSPFKIPSRILILQDPVRSYRIQVPKKFFRILYRITSKNAISQRHKRVFTEGTSSRQPCRHQRPYKLNLLEYCQAHFYTFLFYCSAHGRQCALSAIQKALKSRIINGLLSDR